MYILILTMALKVANAGFGGIEHIEVNSIDDCNRIGRTYLYDVRRQSEGRNVYNRELMYTCIKK